LCGPGPPGRAHARGHLRAGAALEPACRSPAGVARMPGRPRHSAQEPVIHSFMRPAMDIRPILSTLRRHKTAAALIVLEIALSCAIICNAVFLIGERIERM